MLAFVIAFAFIIVFTISIIPPWTRWAKASKDKTIKHKVLGNAGFVLALYGFNGFFAQALIASGANAWIPPHWNYPMGISSCVRDEQQQRFCVSSAGRVQKYAGDGEFIVGWNIDIFGGSARIRRTTDNTIQLITSRRRTLYTFDRDGHLLSTDENAPENMFKQTKEKSRYLWTPLLLVPLAHPWFAWLTGLLGILISRVEDREFWREEFRRRWNS